MSISDRERDWDLRLEWYRRQADQAACDLRNAVRQACYRDHETRQHRDRQPPWCPHCGRTDRGERVKNVDQ